MTRFLERALAGETATRDEWNEHVIAFHRRYSRSTENLVLRMHAPTGESSYDLLASRIKDLAPSARAILDIGCGDGTLLVHLAERFGPQVALTGLDLVEADVAAARARLPAASLVSGDALTVDIGQKSQDVVVSHLAFMAMPAIDEILVRARRALREPGLLAFVVEDPLADSAIFALFGRAIAAVRERFPRFLPVTPGREPIEREETLRTLLDRAGFSEVSIQPFQVSGKLCAEQLWQIVERSYPFGLLERGERERVHDAVRAQTASIAQATTQAAIAMRLVTAHASVE